MSQQTATARVEREPVWHPTLTPYIVVSDARRAMGWYAEVFGARAAASLTSTRTARSATPSWPGAAAPQ